MPARDHYRIFQPELSVSASGEGFDVQIPAFSLDSSNSKRTIN
jgi:hypothetical protein